MSDISWSSDGKMVVGCSNDGTVAVVYLGNELGDVASQREMHSFMYELYSEIPPEPVILHTLRKPMAKKIEPQPMNEQKEIRLQNGKRRIQPVLLSTPSPSGVVQSNPSFSFVPNTAPNISIMSSPSAPSLPSLDLNKIVFKVSLAKVLCSSDSQDYSGSRLSVKLLHISSLINTSGDIVLESMQIDLNPYKSIIRLRKGSKQL